MADQDCFGGINALIDRYGHCSVPCPFCASYELTCKGSIYVCKEITNTKYMYELWLCDKCKAEHVQVHELQFTLRLIRHPHPDEVFT